MDLVVRSAWAGCAGSSARAAAALDAIVARYGEPHRRYHGVGHLERVVADVVALAGSESLDDRGVVIAAAFFHDAVYDPRSASNEADSARLAGQVLRDLGWTEERISEVGRLVLATATHAVERPGDAVLLDADLAVLGAEPAAYETYVHGVRAEYAHVDDHQWQLGRAAVLRSFLERPVIFHTSTYRSRERRARANLAAELSALAR